MERADDADRRPVAAAKSCWFLIAVGQNGSPQSGSRHTDEEPDMKLAQNGLADRWDGNEDPPGKPA